MSRRKSQEQLDDEAQAADDALAAQWQAQQDCSHWQAKPSEYWWSGQVRTMHCPECDATRDFDEVYP